MSQAVRFTGKVAEWSNAPDSKSGVRVSRTEGSNPSLSASVDGPDHGLRVDTPARTMRS